MSSETSKGYIRIPKSQLRLERARKLVNREWHRNVMNIILGKNVCGSCLRLEEDLVHWDTEFVWLHYDNNVFEYDRESSLKNIMLSTFGPNIISIIPTAKFCHKCVDIILAAHQLIFKLRNNCNQIQRKLTEISQQMKWTEYLDETGSLSESLCNKMDLDDNPKTDVNNDLCKPVVGMNKDLTPTIDKNVKTHRIILNNESLKVKLLKDSKMHKYLIKEDMLPEPVLPTGITVRKVRKTVDKSDFAPHDFLELNWAEDDAASITADTQVPSDKLHSNEAYIMNLMENAKNVEKQIHFHDNLQLQAKEPAKVAEQNLNDSLSVKLISNITSENCSDNENEDLVPQDLLELKWPEEQSCNKTHYTKIPVKKLKFNESLTVKFIPSHKLRKVAHTNELAPHELLELDWNDENNTNQTDPKHNIDLTQWLNDQGMRTIKSKGYTNNKRLCNFKTVEPLLKKSTLEKSNENSDTINENKHESNSNTEDLLDCNIIVKNSEVVTEPDDNIIRCALCSLSFVQFESYLSHYKTHKPIEAAKCYTCSANFPVIELLVEHLLLMHSEDMAYCTLCYALLSQGRVAKHMVDYHAKKVEIINAAGSKGLNFCKKCNRTLANSNSPHICGSLECTECKQDCIHQKYLTSYRDQVKANSDVYKCTDCEYQYKTVQDIVRHANYVHLKQKSYQCKFCSSTFSLLADLAKHRESHHLKCQHCKKICEDKIHLKSHNCPKTCELCGETFIALKLFVQHKQTVLAAKSKCVICHCSVPNKCNMARHIKLVHDLCLRTEKNGIVFECTKCKADFNNHNDFTQHVCLYECRACARKFSIKSFYEKHLQAHVDATATYNCSVCGLQLTANSIENHMRNHSDYEKCPTCLNYIEKKLLKHHLESHDTLRLKCPHCTFVCNSHNQYEVHVNRFHLLKRPYECDICKKSFYSKHRLREHIKSHASETRPEQCPICGKKFARKITLNKHIKLHSTAQLFDCNVCGKRYISAARLCKHQKSHRQNNFNLSLPESSQKKSG